MHIFKIRKILLYDWEKCKERRENNTENYNSNLSSTIGEYYVLISVFLFNKTPREIKLTHFVGGKVKKKKTSEGINFNKQYEITTNEYKNVFRFVCLLEFRMPTRPFVWCSKVVYELLTRHKLYLHTNIQTKLFVKNKL